MKARLKETDKVMAEPDLFRTMFGCTSAECPYHDQTRRWGEIVEHAGVWLKEKDGLWRFHAYKGAT